MSRPRILVVRLGALGDVVLALPALRLLRRSLPEAGIGWLVEERNAALLRGHPDLNAVFLAGADRWRRRPFAAATRRDMMALIRALRAERFELALDLQGLAKSVLWARLSGAAQVVGLPLARTRERWSSLLLSARAPAPAGSQHVTDLYLETVRAGLRRLGVDPVEGAANGAPGIVLLPAERAWASAALAAHGLERFAVINPGAAWPTKRWSPERFGALARRLVEGHGLGVFVAAAPAEQALAEAVIESARPARIVTFPTGVRELAALTERAVLMVSGDTGPYHIARDLGVPTVGLFGPTDPARNGPRAATDRLVWGEAPCRPCFGRTCPTAIECMASIRVEQVEARAAELLQDPARCIRS